MNLRVPFICCYIFVCTFYLYLFQENFWKARIICRLVALIGIGVYQDELDKCGCLRVFFKYFTFSGSVMVTFVSSHISHSQQMKYLPDDLELALNCSVFLRSYNYYVSLPQILLGSIWSKFMVHFDKYHHHWDI